MSSQYPDTRIIRTDTRSRIAGNHHNHLVWMIFHNPLCINRDTLNLKNNPNSHHKTTVHEAKMMRFCSTIYNRQGSYYNVQKSDTCYFTYLSTHFKNENSSFIFLELIHTRNFREWPSVASCRGLLVILAYSMRRYFLDYGSWLNGPTAWMISRVDSFLHHYLDFSIYI